VSITGFGLEWRAVRRDLLRPHRRGLFRRDGPDRRSLRRTAEGGRAGRRHAGRQRTPPTPRSRALYARARTGHGKVVDIALVDSMTRFLACRIVPLPGVGRVAPPLRRQGQRHRHLPSVRHGGQADHAGYRERPDLAALLELHRPGGCRREPALRNQRRPLRRPRRAGRQYPGNTPAAHARPVARRLSSSRESRLVRSTASRRSRRITACSGAGFYLPVCRSMGARCRRWGRASCCDGEANLPRRPPPGVGEHTAEVLGKLLGYNEDALASLRRAKAV